MALGMLSLAGSAWGGLLRLGWALPVPAPTLAADHGPLMVAGFLGTVIALERAVALARWWGYAAPLATGLGALALITGLPGPAGRLLMAAGATLVVAVFAVIVRRQAAVFTVVMALGAAAWLVGQVLWAAGWPIHRVVLWWVGFLVLTIAGERLELARLGRPSRASGAVFVAAVALLLAALALTPGTPDLAARALGAALIALALWLGGRDIARRTVRQTGLTRFIAVCLLGGYVWLGVSGALALVQGDVAAGPGYDAMLHAFFLGFVFSMIFGHAPIIFPAVLGWTVTYRSVFYAHLAVLHAGLALRIVGDLADWLPGRRCGGLLNVLALAMFFAVTAYGVLRPKATLNRTRFPRTPS